MDKTFDIVVHGATGFTGRLVVEYLLRKYPQGGASGLRWAMGGRSAAKLAAVRDELGAPADTPLVITNGDDAASLAALMAQTRLVLTTVGPYQLYGSALVGACAAAGVDLSRPVRRAGLDAPDDRCARGSGQGQRRPHRVFLRFRLDPV